MGGGTSKCFTFAFLIGALAFAAPGCDDGGAGDVDSGPGGGVDSGPGGGIDASPGGDDSGTPPTDDGGSPPTDDGGSTPTDGGSTPTRDGAVGSACDMDEDCTEPAGSTCVTRVGSGAFGVEFPGGYCTKEGCTMGGSDCGSGAECVGGFGFTYCAKTCTSGADCREAEGYTCSSPPLGATGTYCLPPTGGFRGDGGFSLPDGGFPGF